MRIVERVVGLMFRDKYGAEAREFFSNADARTCEVYTAAEREQREKDVALVCRAANIGAVEAMPSRKSEVFAAVERLTGKVVAERKDEAR
jgi:hypothetical protein